MVYHMHVHRWLEIGTKCLNFSITGYHSYHGYHTPYRLYLDLGILRYIYLHGFREYLAARGTCMQVCKQVSHMTHALNMYYLHKHF